MDRDRNPDLSLDNLYRARSTISVNRVSDCMAKEIFRRLRKKATLVSRSDRALPLSRT